MFFYVLQLVSLHGSKMRRNPITAGDIFRFVPPPVMYWERHSLSASANNSLTGRRWGVFSEGVSLNHITVYWQRRNKQQSLTVLHCEWSAFPLLFLLLWAWIVFPSPLRMLENLVHTHIQWESEPGCLFVAGTRAFVVCQYHHGCIESGPHCSRSLSAEENLEM